MMIRPTVMTFRRAGISRAAVIALTASLVLLVIGCKKEEPAPAAAPPASKPSPTAARTYAFDGVTITLPAGWKAQPRSNDQGKQIGVEVVGPRDGDWEPNLFFRTFANPEDKPVEEMLTESLERLRQKPDFASKGTQVDALRPGGPRYGRLAYDSKDDVTAQIELSHWYTLVPLPGTRYLEVQASADRQTWAKHEPTFAAVLESLKIGG